MPTVSGRCTDASGAPASGVYIYATPATGARFGGAPGTHSRRDGRWSLELAAGAWTVRETGGKTHVVVVVGDTPVELDAVAAVPAATPTTDDVARLLARRQNLEPPVVSDVVEPVVDHSARDAYMAQIATDNAGPIDQLMQRRRAARDGTDQ